MSKKNWFESLEAVLIFAVPLLFVIPFYAFGFLAEVSGHYLIYSIYIACSLLLTKYNGRSLAEIGLTHKGLISSLGFSGVLVVSAFLRSFIFGWGTIPPLTIEKTNLSIGHQQVTFYA